MKQPIGLDMTADGAGPSVTAGGSDSRQITRALILQSALEIVDRDGVDALSMRRLSDAVNRDTAGGRGSVGGEVGDLRHLCDRLWSFCHRRNAHRMR